MIRFMGQPVEGIKNGREDQGTPIDPLIDDLQQAPKSPKNEGDRSNELHSQLAFLWYGCIAQWRLNNQLPLLHPHGLAG